MRIEIGKRELICWAFLLAIWIPAGTAAGILGVSVLKFLGLVWSIYLFVNYRLYRNKTLRICWIWLAWCLLATRINGTDINVCFAMVHPIFSTVCMIAVLLKKDRVNALRQILNVFCLWTIIQFITFIRLGPSFGTSSHEAKYFFGIRVGYNDFFVFAIGCAILAVLLKEKMAKLQAAIIVGLGVYFALSCKLSTSMMACMVFLCVFIISHFAKSNRIWHGLGIVSVIFCLLFVFGSANPESFSWILVDFLGEDLTLNGRTVLWQQALNQMRGFHWVIGNGYAHNFVFQLNQYWSATTAHSQYINALFCFGIIGLSIYVSMILKTLSIVRLVDRTYWPVIIATDISMILMGISTTFYTSPYMFVWYMVCMALQQGYFSEEQYSDMYLSPA